MDIQKQKNKLSEFKTKLEELQAKAIKESVDFLPILKKVLISNLLKLSTEFNKERDKFEKNLPDKKDIKTKENLNTHLSSYTKYTMFNLEIELINKARQKITKIKSLDELRSFSLEILKTVAKSFTKPLILIGTRLNQLKKTIDFNVQEVIVNNVKEASTYVGTKIKEIVSSK
ncbi:hypothetical protein [Mesomycoplasma hyorhinis]|nr:hypothetical protein [Mesomycoplasma hyorhinis]AEC45996.1 hypothetical protein SRH_02220 [Mesomycoplasma hyorhinis MCLD]AEX14454.1 hypothetical protein MYM_0734 [Mesomycoplasma hyorhinis GDL-1]AHA41490.1 hypothetical protein Q453_0787 [Mesomycoplasma hyorhinis DBS 1050]TRM84369.1 hypothetical protein DJ531_00240 [Sulfolobus sp. A20-N-F6]TRM90491.1 hypothetical protein DJ526_07225 [Sulfolobus sp. A20-N-G8]CRH24767.1 Uncharacterised protein [Chlamydia trachomatis]